MHLQSPTGTGPAVSVAPLGLHNYTLVIHRAAQHITQRCMAVVKSFTSPRRQMAHPQPKYDEMQHRNEPRDCHHLFRFRPCGRRDEHQWMRVSLSSMVTSVLTVVINRPAASHSVAWTYSAPLIQEYPFDHAPYNARAAPALHDAKPASKYFAFSTANAASNDSLYDVASFPR